MVALIFLKWGMPWQSSLNTCFAPSIISVFISMALKPGSTNPIVNEASCSQGGAYALYGDEAGNYQASLQSTFLIIAFICIPLILIPKPLFQYIKNKRERGYARSNINSDVSMHQNLLIDNEVF
jgi:hypothetical protein